MTQRVPDGSRVLPELAVWIEGCCCALAGRRTRRSTLRRQRSAPRTTAASKVRNSHVTLTPPKSRPGCYGLSSPCRGRSWPWGKSKAQFPAWGMHPPRQARRRPRRRPSRRQPRWSGVSRGSSCDGRISPERGRHASSVIRARHATALQVLGPGPSKSARSRPTLLAGSVRRDCGPTRAGGAKP